MDEADKKEFTENLLKNSGADAEISSSKAVSYTHLTLPTSDLV